MIAIASISPLWVWALTGESWISLLFALACFIVALVALIKCAPRNAQRFEAAFKRTKGFWLAMTGGACFLALLGLLGAGPFSLLMPVVGACIAMVYLTDVHPEVSQN